MLSFLWRQLLDDRKELAMIRRLAPVWAVVLVTLAGPAVRAQIPFPRDLIPSRTSLARLGLDRQWTAVVSLNETERLRRISRSADLFFAQTTGGAIHTYDAESGRLLWSASLGGSTPLARPVSSNSYMVFGTTADLLHALDRKTGRPIWTTHVGSIPTCGTVADEDRVMVGTLDGKLIGFSLRKKGPKGDLQIRDKPVEEFGWQTGGQIDTLPLSAERMIAFGSSDGRVYVVMKDERTPLFRIRTRGPIGDGLGDYGTRTLLIPSADNNLYAVDLLTSENLWVFPSGAPIDQAPLVGGEDLFSINQSGYLSSLDPTNGNVRWNTPTPGGRLVALGASKIYLRSWAHDLIMVDRGTGQVVADSQATHQRAGVNLREYGLSMLNRFDDRMYFATDSGMVVCVRETGATQPRPLRDPKALPFGYIPPEGIKKTPPPIPDAETPAEPGAEPKAGDQDKPKNEGAAAPTPEKKAGPGAASNDAESPK
jgi:outer membrane protein assembly factor BamB